MTRVTVTVDGEQVVTAEAVVEGRDTYGRVIVQIGPHVVLDLSGPVADELADALIEAATITGGAGA